jgi:hypothetical protein
MIRPIFYLVNVFCIFNDTVFVLAFVEGGNVERATSRPFFIKLQKFSDLRGSSFTRGADGVDTGQ